MSTSTNQGWPETALLNLERRQQQRLDGLRSGLQAAFSLEIAATTQRQKQDLDARFGRLLDDMRRRPFARDWNTQGSADSNTYTVVRSGRCLGGRIWDVRRCAITAGGSGGDSFTVLANVVAILAKYTLMSPTSSELEPQFQLVTSNGAVPNQYSSTRGGLIVKAGEELAFIVKGAPSGTPLVASWGVEVYPEEAFHQP